jgi:hypothetical protein
VAIDVLVASGSGVPIAGPAARPGLCGGHTLATGAQVMGTVVPNSTDGRATHCGGTLVRQQDAG